MVCFPDDITQKSNVEGKIDEEKLCYFYMITLAPPPSRSFRK